MKINLLQIKVEELPELNIEKVHNLTKDYKNEIFILPELFTTGFNYDHVKKHVNNHPEILNNLPKENVYIGSVTRSVNGKIYNSFFIKDGRKIDFIYNKIHLFPLMDEDLHFSGGTDITTFELQEYKCGCAICFDLRFPELFRKYFLQNVDIIIIPMQWPDSRISQMIPLATARAIENQCYVAVCNAAGKIWNTDFGGHSMIISPLGEILAAGKSEVDKIFSANIEKNVINNFRAAMPISKCLKML